MIAILGAMVGWSVCRKRRCFALDWVLYLWEITRGGEVNRCGKEELFSWVHCKVFLLILLEAGFR